VVPALFGPLGLIGGGERYPLELARAMASRTETRLICFGSRPCVERDGALEIRTVRNWLPLRRFVVDPFNPGLLAHIADADVIHYHQTHTLSAGYALLYARARNTPVFGTNLGGGGLAIHNMFGGDRWFDAALDISRFASVAFKHERLPNARVILGGVDPVRFSPDPTAQRTGDVLFVGRLLPHKGINYLIEALDAATPLTIVGRRWWRRHDRFQDLMRTLANGKRVAIHPDYTDEQVIAAYRRALCVVLPSVYVTVFGERYKVPELLGQTLLESMACGTPAICTDVGGMPEVVEDGVTGFVVPPNDPRALGERIRWLQTHADAAARMGAAGRQRVLERFTWDLVVDRCFEAYRSRRA